MSRDFLPGANHTLRIRRKRISLHSSVYTDEIYDDCVGPLGAYGEISERVTLEIKAADAFHRGSAIENAARSNEHKVSRQSLLDFGPMLVLDFVEKRALKLLATGGARESRCPLTPESTTRGDEAEDKN